MSQSNLKFPNDSEQTRWLTLAKSGDNFAFNNVVEKYQQPIYSFCYRMLNDADEAEEATQEALLRAYTKLNSYDGKRLFSTWLFSIASNYCLDILRKRRVQTSAWDELVSQQYLSTLETAPERSLIKAEVTQEVQDLLKTLPSEHRTTVILKYWYAMSYEEIAQTLNTTVSTIKSRLFRARKMMATKAVMAEATPLIQSATTPNQVGLAVS